MQGVTKKYFQNDAGAMEHTQSLAASTLCLEITFLVVPL